MAAISKKDYFDIPDGTETDKKLWIAFKNVGIAALGVGTADVLLNSHPKGYLATFRRLGYICVPILGITATFIITTDLATNFRQKNDQLNWVVGGIAAGLVCGVWRKNPFVATGTSALFGVCGFAKKEALINNYTLFDYKMKTQRGSLRSVNQDWTLTRDRPGNWTRHG